MRNDLTKLFMCRLCHKPFLQNGPVFHENHQGEMVPSDTCTPCTEAYIFQQEYMEEGYRQARQERYDAWLKERDNWRMDQFEKRLDEQYRQRQLADQYHAEHCNSENYNHRVLFG